MNSKKALNYLTSEVFTGGNSVLEIEAEECKRIILQDLDRLEKLEKAIEILKDKMSLILFDYPPYEIWLEKKSEELTQEEYNLLKEVLGND